MFESDRDVVQFTRRLAKAVELGLIEVHAFVVMQTHFHLLLLSLLGELSRALHFLEAAYAQWFNRSRERDGPIHRGRFHAKRVDSEVYMRRVVSYIDSNPVVAGLSRHPALYPHGSARLFARRSGPVWHARHWVEEQVCIRVAKGEYDPEDYPRAFPPLLDVPADDPLCRQVPDGALLQPSVDFLLSTTGEGRARWIKDLAVHADGTRALRPILSPTAILRVVQAMPFDDRPIHRSTGKATPRTVALAFLLRKTSGATLTEIARRVGCAPSAVGRLVETAVERLMLDQDFECRVEGAFRAALEQTYGAWRY